MTSWTPSDLSEVCAVDTNLNSCSASTFIFLQMVASLFGYSKDSAPHLYQRNLYGSRYASYGYGGASYRKQGEDFGQSRDEKLDADNHYDFIVVGAGSAGCVVTNRLTEIKGWRVLLLEAGPEEPEVADVPSFAPLLQRSSIDWAYTTQPSPHSCLARPNGQCAWTRGKVMGGSSSINYMLYIRGGAEDYNEWAEMGNPGWSYQEILPYFIRSENNVNPELVDPGYHGQGGYQNVEIHRYQDQNIFPILDAYRELGLPENDPNGRQQIGTSIIQATVRDGRRLSTNGAFIRPIRGKRHNLVVQTDARVTKVLIESKSRDAYGVEYYVKGEFRRAYARKEVIVSAGTVNSPQVLMLSGIGPSDHLNSHGIKVIHDLPVGLNLQDHTTLDGVVFALANSSSTTVDDRTRAKDVAYYKETRRGPLSATGTIQVNAMVQTKYETSLQRPDIQYTVDTTNVNDFYTDPILAIRTNVIPLAYYNGFMIRPILLNPESRGYIKLNNSDPVFGAPLIFPNTFAEEIDLLRLLEGVKLILNIGQTYSFRKLGSELVTTPLPACAYLEYGTDDYWICVLKSYTSTIFHPVGTCKMGPKYDSAAVVDSELRVYGINNLRVIDASIMPKIVRGNTNAPTIMIGERGSDFIKAKWLGKEQKKVTENLLLQDHNQLYTGIVQDALI